MYKTNDFFKMAFIRMKLGKAPDEVETCEGFTRRGRLQGVAVYNDDTDIKEVMSEMTEFIERFKGPFQEIKSMVMREVKKQERGQ